MPELVTIPISFLELTIDYESPLLKMWNDRAEIIQGLFDAMKPWKPNVDDLEHNATGKTSEQGFTLKLPLKKASWFFGPAWCRFTRDDADWDFAEETINMIEAATTVVVDITKVPMSTKRAAISLHVQPRTMQFMEILHPFVPKQFFGLESSEIRTMAAVAKWPKRRVTIDGSGVLANGFFLKFEREFDCTATNEDMANQLKKDEEELFGILGVEEDRS